MSGRTAGFMVWNPARGMPTVVHDTLEAALEEADRLYRLNPGERFLVMSPVLAGPDATVAKAWSDGLQQGRDEAKAEIARADDRAMRINRDLKNRDLELSSVRAIVRQHRRFQAIVADCLLWFDGFAAAHTHRDEGRPRIPDREDLRQLNHALQKLEPQTHDLDEEIPF